MVTIPVLDCGSVLDSVPVGEIDMFTDAFECLQSGSSDTQSVRMSLSAASAAQADLVLSCAAALLATGLDNELTWGELRAAHEEAAELWVHVALSVLADEVCDATPASELAGFLSVVFAALDGVVVVSAPAREALTEELCSPEPYVDAQRLAEFPELLVVLLSAASFARHGAAFVPEPARVFDDVAVLVVGPLVEHVVSSAADAGVSLSELCGVFQ